LDSFAEKCSKEQLILANTLYSVFLQMISLASSNLYQDGCKEEGSSQYGS